MKQFLVATAFLLLAASPALAQSEDSGYMVGIGGGVTVPTGDLGDAYDPNYSISGYLSGPISGMFGWRVQAAFDRFSPNSDLEAICDVSGDSCNARFSHFGGGVQLNGSGGGTVVPYGYFTVGAYNLDPDIQGVDGSTDFGIGFGGGLNWMLGDAWGVGFDLRVNGVWPDGDESNTLWHVVPSGMFVWRF